MREKTGENGKERGEKMERKKNGGSLCGSWGKKKRKKMGRIDGSRPCMVFEWIKKICGCLGEKKMERSWGSQEWDGWLGVSFGLRKGWKKWGERKMGGPAKWKKR